MCFCYDAVAFPEKDVAGQVIEHRREEFNNLVSRALGKIAEEQKNYLMARGFSKSEAEALIVRGFMDVSIFGLPKELETAIQKIIDTTTMRAL
jgi:hypothetical protein